MRGTPDRLTPALPAPLPAAWWQALADAPWARSFFHTLREIDARSGKPRLGTARRPVDEPLRLGQTPALSFAPSELHAVELDAVNGKPRMEVRFFGLFGPQGPLPLHLTEYAHERLRHHGDASFVRFADLFHHRLLLLFYRAWAQAQPTVSLDRPAEDRFGAYIGSLIGLGDATQRQRDAAPDAAKLHFAGLLSRQVRNADGLAQLLTGYLRRPVRVEQFAGGWMALPHSERSRVGRFVGGRRNTTAQLGRSAVLGSMVWDRQHHFRLHIGPLDRPAFEALLPVGSALPALAALVEHYAGAEFAWDLQLGLKRDQVKRTRLGRHGRLGWNTWIGRRRPPQAQLRLAPGPAVQRAMREHRPPAAAPSA